MVDEDVARILKIYSEIAFKPPPAQYTVAAAFFLVSPFSPSLKVISLATGTKCLPTSRYPLKGEALHDSHAEVVARRGAIRWFLEEIGRCEAPSGYVSSWIKRDNEKAERYGLREGVQVSLYVSTVPCGDASMRFLASVQDEEMAALKDSTVYAPLGVNEASRGRDNYARLGVLRTKPGRADSPQTQCEVPLEMRDIVREDCERALWGRLSSMKEWCPPFMLHTPEIKFTTHPFIHSRTVIESNGVSSNGSCNEALSWIADSTPSSEVLINGLRRGVSPKHRFRTKARPRLSKIAMLSLHSETLEAFGLEPLQPSTTYHAAKSAQSESLYKATKDMLLGPQGAFSGWVRSGKAWQDFNLYQRSPVGGSIKTLP
ncbi:hypothetical protein H0H81_009914 [Sphagnurus paluster]|uniref:A to I editase domain-containing protein n=1 Tax=Sphagnurus paluster TaxID=117069 RepID=A0A9P7GSM5_9AGAR|nr:hypothetical protein H0H81_009914 [Sphagnurus paluster]